MNKTRKYEQSLNLRRKMRFKTRSVDADNYDGIGIAHSKSMLIMREVEAFLFDGVVVLPKKIIRGIRDGKFEDCANKMLTFSGEIQKLEFPEWLHECDTIKDVLRELMERDIWPSVEINFKSKSALYIGPIIQLHKHRFTLLGYDAMGRWEEEAALKYKEIVKIEFDGQYVNLFNNYMRATNPPPTKSH